jgi:hypothetical protein
MSDATPSPPRPLGPVVLGLALGLAGLALTRVPAAGIARFRWTPNDFADLILLVGFTQLAALLAVSYAGARSARPRPGLALLPALVALAAAIVHHQGARAQGATLDVGPLGRLLNPQVDIGAMRLLVASGLGASAVLLIVAALSLPPAARAVDADAPAPPSTSARRGAALACAASLALMLASRALVPVELGAYDLLVLLALLAETALLLAALAARAPLRTGAPGLAALAVPVASLAALEQARAIAVLTGFQGSESAATLERAAQSSTLRPLLSLLDAALALALLAVVRAARPGPRVARPTLRSAAPWLAAALALTAGLELIAARELAAPLAFYARFVGIDLPAVAGPVDRPLGDLPALRALFLQADGALRFDDSDGLTPPIALGPDTLLAAPRSPFIAQSDERAQLQAASRRRPPVRRYLLAADRRASYGTLSSALTTLPDQAFEIELGLLAAAVDAPDTPGTGSDALVSTHFRDRTLVRFLPLPRVAALPLCARRPPVDGAPPALVLEACLDPLLVLAGPEALRLAVPGLGTLTLPAAGDPASMRERALARAHLLDTLRGRALVLAPETEGTLAQLVLALDQVGALTRAGKAGSLFSRLFITPDRTGIWEIIDREGAARLPGRPAGDLR